MNKLAKLLCVPLAVLLCGLSVAAAPAATLKETVVTPPQMAQKDDYPVSVVPHSDGSVDFFTMKAEPGTENYVLRRYQSKDGGKNWTEIPCKWAVPVSKAYGLYGETNLFTEDIYIADDGTCYFAVMGTDQIPHFIEAKQDGSYQELPMPAWKTDHLDTTVSKVGVDKAGNWVFSYFSMIGTVYMEVIDRNTGALKQRVLDDNQDGWDAVFSGNTAVAGGGFDYLTFYDLSAGKRLRDVALPWTSDGRGSGETILTMDETGAAYIAIKYGIARLAPGGSTFETIVDGSRCYLGDKSCSLRKFSKQPGADVFYIVMHLDDKFMLCRYAAS